MVYVGLKYAISLLSELFLFGGRYLKLRLI